MISIGLVFQNGDLKKETEILIVVAQNQSIRTNLAKARIEVVVVNLHRRSKREGMITWEK